MVSLFNKRKTLDGVKRLKKISYSTLLVLEKAEKFGIEWQKLPYTNIFKLRYQSQVKYFHGQIPANTTATAFCCCKNKRITKNLLEEAGLSVSKGYLLKYSDSQSYKDKIFKKLNKPVVVKPVDDMQGNNVYLNIKSKSAYLKAIDNIYGYYGQKKANLLVEQMFVGEEYRILATQDKILSVIKRLPANVTGDGKTNIHDLIKIKNKDPLRQKVTTYKSIVINEQLKSFLLKQNLNLDFVPQKGQQIFLLPHSSLDISLGGDTVDVTEKIHPSVIKIVKKIMDSIPGLALAGIDFMSLDIVSKQTKNKYRIIEVNASPSLDWNEFPLIGSQRPIAYEFLKIMFPDL